MPLILRAEKGSKLTISEMDGNLLWLAGNISGSSAGGVIPVTGSSIDASNTPITSSFFVGDGSKLTNITASFITSSNVYGPYGANSVLSSSFAVSASYIVSSSYALSASFATTSSYTVSASYALSSSYADSAERARSASYALSASYARSASYAVSSSYALSASYAKNSSLATTSSYVSVKAGNNIIVNYVGSTIEITGSAGTWTYLEGTLSTQLQYNNNRCIWWSN